MYQTLADAVLVLHAGFVLFVVGGLALILLGNALGWRWVNGRRFRLLHLAAIAGVVSQSLAGITCPLTSLESWLREQSGATAYEAGFIQHWVGSFLYYRAPVWVFTVIYAGFGLLVILTWWMFPPMHRQRLEQDKRDVVIGDGRG